MAVERLPILRLYKELLKYSTELKYTDKVWYQRRVREEFRKNKNLTELEDIKFYVKVNNASLKVQINLCFNLITVFAERISLLAKQTFDVDTSLMNTLTRTSLIHSCIIRKYYNNLTLVRHITKKIKDQLDYSHYPKTEESDLEESFTHGSGPGGQAVNKANNCVLLKHVPTGM